MHHLPHYWQQQNLPNLNTHHFLKMLPSPLFIFIYSIPNQAAGTSLVVSPLNTQPFGLYQSVVSPLLKLCIIHLEEKVNKAC